jgi:4-amino-4-deoxy-L-arabinose transferase-like glycosyltransferase
MLLVLGAIGLLVHSHEAVPEIGSLAALCGALAALPYAQRRPLLAGAAFGAALGLSALSALWVAPAALGVAVAAAHFACPQWRTRAAGPFLGMALLVGLAVAASWPLVLAVRAPHAFTEWRVLAFSPEGTPIGSLRYYLSTASWFTWPAWPLALWSAWSLRRRWNDPRLFVPAVAIVATLFGLVFWGPTEDVALIPALAPLALLASQAVFTLRRGAAGALDWFGVLTFAVFAVLLWLGYCALMLGVPPTVAHNLVRIAPGYAPHFSPLAIVFTLALTVGWLYLIFFTPHAPLRSVARWAAGIVLLWGTFAMLALPWIDYQRSYRRVALELRAKLPAGAGCISAKALGVSQAAALDYHGGIRTRPFDPLRSDACRLLLIQGGPKEEDFDVPTAGWRKLADVGRPGDRNERYRLYRRGK